MSEVTEVKDFLKPFVFHGMEFKIDPSSVQAISDCPFCGKERKFYVNRTNGKWDCKRCAETGNVYGFLRKLYEMSSDSTQISDLMELAEDRKLLDPGVLKWWGVSKSIITTDWLIPGYDGQNKLQTLYRYSYEPIDDRYELHVTTGTNVRLFGIEQWDNNKPSVMICEGPWDAMALWEVSRRCKKTVSSYKLTNEEDNLLSECNIVAVPSCGTLRPEWLPFFSGKKVTLLYDNDHPKRHPVTDKMGKSAGTAGMQRAAMLLAQYEQPPSSIHYLQWGSKPDQGHDPKLPDGYDVRDHLTKSTSISDRVESLTTLFQRIKPVPEEWIPGRSAESVEAGKPKIELLPCDKWVTIVNEFKKAMKWTEGLDRGLSVMLACVTSVPIAGDQLWVKMISPASSGKTTLCEALAVCDQYIESQSNIRGFHSGYLSDKQGTEDHSLINKAKNKTLVIKDGDTLLQAPNLGQILAEARDIYDRTSRSHYRHGKGRAYSDINMTIILCGTLGLRKLDDSELGQRFLDCRIMDKIDEDQENVVNTKKLNQFSDLIRTNPSANGKGSEGEDMLSAKQLTGGYVKYLRENVIDLIRQVEMSDHAREQCKAYGKFVAYLRARPSKLQDEEVQREMSTRLVMQFAKLAYCLAVVLNKKSVDEEVLRRVKSVALDTTRGRTIRLVKYLYAAGTRGCSAGGLSSYTSETEDKCLSLLKFLQKIDAVQCYEPNPNQRTRQYTRWRLTPHMYDLYKTVIGDNSDE